MPLRRLVIMAVIALLGALCAVYFTNMAMLFASNKHIVAKGYVAPRDVQEDIELQVTDKQDHIDQRRECNHAPQTEVLPAKDSEEELAMIQSELARLSHDDMMRQSAELKEEIYRENLIERMNRNEVSDSERHKAQDIILRVVLLGVEKAHRELKELTPTLEKQLYEHKAKVAGLRRELYDGT